MKQDTTDPAVTTESIDAMVRRIQADTERVMRLRSSLETMEIIGSADRGAVTVRLLGTGRFTAIDIDPDALRSTDAQALGALVLTAVNDGLARLHERSRAMFAPQVTEAGA